MLARTCGLLSASLGSITPQAAGGGLTASSTSPWLERRRGTRPRPRQRRSHATTRDHISRDDGSSPRRNLSWPTPPKGEPHPTPYQIFAMSDSAAYSKGRFYELVKLYHPDKSWPAASTDSHARAIRIERYRLVVAAHTILSDPARRAAYDRCGAGWNGRGEPGSEPGSYQQASPYSRPGPFSSGWGPQPNDPIWRNATWEDWERFYAARAREAGGGSGAGATAAQAPTYIDNAYFVALVVILALLGSSANYTRARDAGAYVVERRDIVHDQSSKDLRRVRQEVSAGDRSQRIDWFMRNRGAALGGEDDDMAALREERADRLLPVREVCRSDEVRGNDG